MTDNSSSLLKNIALLIITLIIFLIIFEVTLRITQKRVNVYAYNYSDLVQYSDSYGWELKPNVTKTFIIPERTFLVEQSSQGFRDYEHNLRKSAGKYRIVVVGDSMTHGWGVDNNQTYSKVLESYNKKIETINMGVGAYGTDQEYLTVINKGLSMKPDMIILMYTVTNDVGDVNTNFRPWPKPQYKIINYSLTLTNVPVPEFNVGNKEEYKKPNFFKSLRTYEFLRDNLISIPIIRDFLIEKFHIGRHYDFKENYDVVFKILLKLKEDLDSKEVPLLIIVMTDRDQLIGLTSNRSISYMTDFFDENNFTYLDMYDYFKESPQEFYFKIDGHINEEGHKKVAEAIYQELSEVIK